MNRAMPPTTVRCHYSAVLLQCGVTTVRYYYSAVRGVLSGPTISD